MSGKLSINSPKLPLWKGLPVSSSLTLLFLSFMRQVLTFFNEMGLYFSGTQKYNLQEVISQGMEESKG
jgi:hypothetical protein